MSNGMKFEAMYPFEGNPAERQISFPAGVVLIADNVRKQSNGWIWVRAVSANTAGWCPMSYLVPRKEPQTVQPSSSPRSPTELSPTTFPEPAGWGHPQQPQQQQQVPSSPQGTSKLGNKFKGLKSNVQTFGSNAGSVLTSSASKVGSAIKTGATKAGTGIQNAATETKHRIQDLKQQRQHQHQHPHSGSVPANYNVDYGLPQQQQAYQQQQPQQQPAKPQQQQQRTPTEQVAINAGNGAARHAVVGGIYSGVFHGPQGAIRGAQRGAVFGGAVVPHKIGNPLDERVERKEVK